MQANRQPSRGITLVEILIAAMVISMTFSAVYFVYRGVTKSFTATNWSLTMQTHARNGLTFLREEMQRASYKTTIKISEVQVEEDKQMKVKEGTTQGDAVLAEWFIGIPFRTDVPSSGACFKSSVELSGGKLLYKKVLESGTNPGEPVFNGRVLMENVSSASIAVSAFDVDAATGSQLVTVAVELHHPDKDHFPNTKVIEQTGAKVDVKVGHL